MGMLGNGSRNSFGTGYLVGSVFANTVGARRNKGEWTNWCAQDGATTYLKGAAFPSGYNSESAFYRPMIAGEISMRFEGDGGLDADLYASRNMAADFTGTGSITLGIQGRSNMGLTITGSGDLAATAQGLGNILIALSGNGDLAAALAGAVDMQIAMAGNGDMTALANLIISMSADFTGSGDLAASISGGVTMSIDFDGAGDMVAAINGRRNMSADFTGSGDMSADLYGIGNMLCALTGTGDLDALIAAYGDMSIDISTAGSGLSVGAIVDGVWNAVAANYDDAGTMGEKLNAAGTAGDPWTGLIEGSLTAGDVMRILLSVAAGETTIVDNGGGAATVTFKSQDGTINRIVATMDGSERTQITIVEE